MKKLLLPFLGIILSINVIAQANKTNLVVFSEDGDKFYLVINGIRQNMKSETNVKVTDLTTENFSFTIIFEDSKIPSIKKTQALPFGNEYTYRIKDKKGKKAMKYFGETALSAPSNNTGSTTIVYHTTEEVPVTSTNSNSGTNNSTVSTNVTGTGNATGVNTSLNVGTGTNETSTTTTTTTTTSTGGSTSGNTGSNGVGITMNVNENKTATGGTVSTGVNAGGVGMNIDIIVSENGASINMGGTGLNPDNSTTTNTGNYGTTTTTGNSTSGTNVSGTTTTTYSSTTTTTTSTSSTGGTALSTNTNVTGTGVNTTSTTGNTGSSTYTGTTNYACGAAMNSTDFESAKKSIDSKDFEDSKFTVAKQVTKSNCLNTTQIKEVMELFDFEATKLDYAKFAYDFCYDKNNYYKLNDAFDFESSVDDLNSYLEKK